MKYLIISDLHLGDGTGSDDFVYEGNKKHSENDVKLANWIDSLRPDIVILAGDIYELWQHRLKRIKKAHSLLWNTFNNKLKLGYKFIRLVGNHDYQLLGKSTYTITTKSGKKILISHGFQNDKSMKNPFVRFGVWCLGLVEKIIPNIEVVERVFKNSSVSKQIEENTMQYAYSKFNEYNIVVCGHTHDQTAVHFDINGNNWYYNTGTCQHGKLEGILIDSDKDYDDGVDFIRMVRG
jgi:UDP-2,3-diacylglucosamine pyrophosphatase LpxH